MTISLAEIGKTIFKRSDSVNMSDFRSDIKTFNILFALDGRRSVQTIAAEDNFDIDELSNKMKDLYDRGLIERAMDNVISRGRSKKLLDAIILKRSRGVGAIAKAIKIKIALKGINPDSLTPDTPDDPVLLRKLVALARSYGLVVKTKADRTKGRTKLLIDSIITQRSGGDPMVAKMLKTKFMLKGINPDAYSLDTEDDPGIVRRLTDLASKLGIKIPSAKAQARSAAKIEQML
jgi:hypothetical protein